MDTLNNYFNELKREYGNEIPTILNDIREAVEHGLTNAILIDEVLNTTPQTQEAKNILAKLDMQGIRTPYAKDISNTFYHLRALNDLLTQINRHINN